MTADDRGRLLVRTFFSRLFESELMPPGLPQVRLLIWTAALIYGPSLFLPAQMWGHYNYLAAWRPELLQPAIWDGKIQLLLISMVPAGLIALVIWDGVFPDRRDAHIMSVLPVSNGLVVAARLAALGLALALIAFSVALPVGLVFGSVIGEYQGGFIRAFAGHVVSSAMASAFVFCAVLAVQSVLVTIARGRWIHRLIVWGQFAAVILLLQMAIFQGRMVGRVRGLLEAGIADPDAALLWAPPLWFLGLNETISGGSGGDAFRLLAWRAVLMTAGIGGAALLLYIVGYRRLVRRALETQDVPLSASFGRIGRLSARLARPISASRPVASAVFSFVVASFARSQRHRLLYGIYIGIGCAIAVAGLMHAADQGWTALRSPTTPLLSIPLVLTFLAVVGARVLFAIPVEPSANWVFRLTEPHDVRPHLAGARLALLLIAAGPPVALSLPIYTALWGFKPAIAHAVYVLVLAWLLVETVMWRFARVPFTAPYMPGRANVRLFWPVYLMLFTTYAYTMAELESRVLGQPFWYAVTIGAIAVSALLVSLASARLGARRLLVFEAPEDEVTTLALSAPS